jgi:hypothetical protein
MVKMRIQVLLLLLPLPQTNQWLVLRHPRMQKMRNHHP